MLLGCCELASGFMWRSIVQGETSNGWGTTRSRTPGNISRWKKGAIFEKEEKKESFEAERSLHPAG